MSFPDPNSDDHLRVAELAAARLERQSKRIIENDPTIPMSKIGSTKGTRNKAPKQWLFIDHADLSEGEMTSTSHASRKESPFDVHAKVFRPGSRDKSLSRNREPLQTDSAYLSLDDDDFQLVTSKKNKPSSAKPAVGLNAHQIKIDDKPSAIAVPFDRHEMNEVFGNDLPPLTYFQMVTGEKDGMVSFALHPNGDVSAQQWLEKEYQWVNIGQFSNVRRRTEGSLASHRLKGENELHCLLRHTLAYFRAVAKQHEAYVMKLPFGLKELQAAMPKIPVDRTARKAGTPSSATGIPIRSEFERRSECRKQQTHMSSLGPDPQSWARAPSHLGSKHRLSSSSRPPAPSNFSIQPECSFSATEHNTSLTNANDHSPQDPAVLNSGAFGSFFTPRDLTPAEQSSRSDGLKESRTLRSGMSEYLRTFLPRSVSQTAISQIHSPLPDLNFSKFLEHSQPSAVLSNQAMTPARRDFAKALLNKIFDATTPRNMNAGSGPRTVLHDPFQSQSEMVSTTAKTSFPDLQKKQSDALWSSIPIGQTPSWYTRQTTSDSSEDDVDYDLRKSEPDDDVDSNPKPLKMIDITLPHMTNEELALYSRPSPQDFNGPFFMGSPGVPSEASTKSHDQELREWFYGGLMTIERQDEHFRFIKAAHHQTHNVAQSAAKPGPIGTPHVLSTLDKKQEPETFNEVTTRLFFSVHESLAQYTQGPLDQRHGYLAPFCDPPEWCIDKSANGNNSFFGEDWGQPPERISRDSRYRPLPFESKFGVFDGHRGPSTGGISSLNGRIRFGSGQKY